MSNFIRFTAWLENRVNEDAPMGAPGVADDTAIKAKNAKAAQLATTKYGIDMAKLAKDPKALKAAQDKVVGDPNLGPEVAASLFKNMGM
jgi:hypothetical protein